MFNRGLYRQVATLWSGQVSDGFGGYTFASKAEIRCRWEDKNEQFSTEAAETEVSKAVVYTDEVVEPGDYLLLGSTTELSPAEAQAHKVRAVMNIPALRRASSERRIFV